MNPPPAEIGAPLAEVETPALIVDLTAYEANVERLQRFADQRGVGLRPHAKTHKCAAIALYQMRAGAVGVCCQKTSEAQALVEAGVPDVVISNEVVGAPKIARLVELSTRATVSVCVDDAGNVDALSAAMAPHRRQLGVLVEIDVGAGRCGVGTVEDAVGLARRITDAPGLHFKGLQAYHGGAQHVRDFHQRCEAAKGAIVRAFEAHRALIDNGLKCEIVSGGGTGSYVLEAESGVYNELQCGSYIFMDVDYGRNRARDGAWYREFRNSLFVYTTVMSKVRSDVAVVDAGLKAVSVDSGMPRVCGFQGVSYVAASDEHGKLEIKSPQTPLTLGDKLMLIPGHCDPTVNMYDWLVGFRDGWVETIWPVTARGRLL